ncbi:MAG: hypothetical protein BMS9Abin05_2369 [Rhodothermia bacterium]|nr:MAG: hypothetical protein BMS9Abin05_2369 [Rhodothermia bacterium]
MHAIPYPCKLSVHFEEALKSFFSGIPGINEPENASVMLAESVLTVSVLSTRNSGIGALQGCPAGTAFLFS